MSKDDDTVAAAKNGDADAWRELYRAHAGRLLLWLTRRSPEDGGAAAEDVAAESWLTAASKIQEFRGTSDEFAGWLFGIARLQAANHRRRVARRQTDPTDLEELRGPEVTVAGPEPATADRDWVQRALAALPQRERDVVTCLEVLDLDVPTTARALGMSAVAIRVARHRGLKRLRAQADATDDAPGEPAAPATAT